MKKSSFTTLILGTVSGVLFALGMCMALIPDWNAFKPGIIFGALGIILGLGWRESNPLRFGSPPFPVGFALIFEIRRVFLQIRGFAERKNAETQTLRPAI